MAQLHESCIMIVAMETELVQISNVFRFRFLEFAAKLVDISSETVFSFLPYSIEDSSHAHLCS